MDEHDRFRYLCSRYKRGELSSAEHDEFFELVNSGDHEADLDSALREDWVQGENAQEPNLPHHLAQEIIRNIMSGERSTEQLVTRHKKIPFIPVIKWAVAASLALGLFGAYYMVSRKTGKAPAPAFAQALPAGLRAQANTSSKPVSVFLPDSSVVILEPGASIRFPPAFAPDKREVFLEGKGLFQVRQDSRRAFMVYYQDIVTKVLGTSFTVGMDSLSGQAEVQVITGKVLVFGNRRPGVKSVIVTPNQKVTFDQEKNLLEIGLADHPIPISAPGQQESVRHSWTYDQEKLSVILAEMQRQYGIDMITATDAINNCEFSGDLSMDDLFVKLRIICLATNTSYEISGSRILITGKGCR